MIGGLIAHDIIVKLVTPSIDWEATLDEGEEYIIRIVMLRGMVFNIGLVRELELSVPLFRMDCLSWSSGWATKSSLA